MRLYQPIFAPALELGSFQFDSAHLQLQTHLAPPIMHQNIALIQRHFCYVKTCFEV